MTERVCVMEWSEHRIGWGRSVAYLEEVVLEEVPHGLVAGDGPPAVQVEVQSREPDDEDQGRELGLVADGHEEHQG